MYRLWCTRNKSMPDAKMKAADAMATAWKLAWDEDEPYDAEFHESAAFDLLALLGIMHQLPTPMVRDPEFTKNVD